MPNSYLYTGVDGRTPGVPECDGDAAGGKLKDQSATEDKEYKDWNLRPNFSRHPDRRPSTFPRALYVNYDENTAGAYEVTYKLVNYYERQNDAAGTDAVIHWNFFKNVSGLREKFYSIPIGGEGSFEAPGNGVAGSKVENDIRLSFGRFDIYRLDEHCAVVHDYYDVDALYWPWAVDASTGTATEFNVLASGCFD